MAYFASMKPHHLNVDILHYQWYSSSFPNIFPLLCGVDVSYETPPFSSVLRVLPGQFSLRQVVPDAIQPPPPTYSSSLFKTCPYHFNLLSCTFLDISPTFVAPLILSFLILSSLVPHPTSSLVLSSLPKSRHLTSLLVLQLSCILSP